jgi:hypothetical protein
MLDGCDAMDIQWRDKFELRLLASFTTNRLNTYHK